MWIEVKPNDHPKEVLWFGPGGIVAVSPGAVGSVLVFATGSELDIEDDYARLKSMLLGA